MQNSGSLSLSARGGGYTATTVVELATMSNSVASMFGKSMIVRFSILSALLVLNVTASAAKHEIKLGEADFPPIYDTRADGERHGTLGAAALDINGDDAVDFFIGQGDGKNDVLVTQNTETKWVVTTLDPSNTEVSTAALAVDINRDFRPDLIVARHSGTYLYINNGKGGFARQGRLPIAQHRLGDGVTVALVAGDVNGDGWVDIFESRRDGSAGDGDRLWINAGRLSHGRALFKEQGFDRNISSCCSSTAAAFVDFDHDRDLDLLVAGLSGQLTLMVNDGTGKFQAESLDIAGGDWSSLGTGDIDNDGDVDIVVGGKVRDENFSALRILENKDAQFTDVTEKLGVMVHADASTVALTDFDADGYVDIAVASPRDANKNAGRYLRNNRAMRRFDDVSEGAPAMDLDLAGFVVADVDRDGFSDQVLMTRGGQFKMVLNGTTRTNWLGVRLRGRDERTVSGAEIVLRMKDGTRLTGYYKHGEGAAISANDEVMFGLGPRSEITVLEINWPSGKYTRVDGPEANRHIGFVEPSDENQSDISIKYPMFGYLEQFNKRLETDPGLRERTRPKPRMVCR